MFKKTTLATAISVLSLGAAFSAPVSAQEGVMEEVYVTGSRIARNKFEYSSPVSVYGSEDLESSGATSLDEFLLKQPEDWRSARRPTTATTARRWSTCAGSATSARWC